MAMYYNELTTLGKVTGHFLRDTKTEKFELACEKQPTKKGMR